MPWLLQNMSSYRAYYGCKIGNQGPWKSMVPQKPWPCQSGFI